ncbi:glycine-rich domain-containing protein [Undibacterium sp. Di26W]|uniref:glycine-rich domain-containing protein n=1 Tax=Undibacterium sp. Di26W TaxID=3413035 RepID=UPI003BF224FA
MPILMTIVVLLLSLSLLFVWMRWRRAAQADYIRSYMFPPGLLERLHKQRPDLSLKDQHLLARALRQFFLVYLKCGYKHIAMPSQVVDELWHEFILYTKNYEQFCKKAFGRYMHHTPAAVLGSNLRNNDGLRRTWWFACLEENINPRRATRLPLLFALDAKWNIADGFRYEPDCSALRANADGTVYCGGDFYGGGSDGPYDFGDTTNDGGSGSNADSGSSDSGNDSSGCSGGCSGGCSSGD